MIRNQIRTAFAPRDTEQHGTGPQSSRAVGHHSSVFVIGMGDHMQHAGGGLQPTQRLLDANGASVKPHNFLRNGKLWGEYEKQHENSGRHGSMLHFDGLMDLGEQQN
jgi:hypothetical protein